MSVNSKHTHMIKIHHEKLQLPTINISHTQNALIYYKKNLTKNKMGYHF